MRTEPTLAIVRCRSLTLSPMLSSALRPQVPVSVNNVGVRTHAHTDRGQKGRTRCELATWVVTHRRHGDARGSAVLLCCSAALSVQPFHNPAESYTYYSLPYCMPKSVDRCAPSHHGADGTDADLGEVLAGDRRRASLYDLRFDVDITWTPLCHFRLSQDDIKSFIDAIRQHYIFEMFVDDLGVKGFIGEIDEIQTKYDSHIHNETHIYLFTHLDFSIAYNGNNVIAVNLTTDPQQRQELEFGKDVRCATLCTRSRSASSFSSSSLLFPSTA